MSNLPLQTQILTIATALCLLGAMIDYRTGHIPNWLTLGALCLGPPTQVWLSHLAFPEISWMIFAATSAMGIVFTGLVPFLLWKRSAMGGGDVKLLAALGGLLGPLLGMQVQLYAFLVALLLAPAKLAYEGKLIQAMKNTAVVALNPFRRKDRKQTVSPAVLSEYRFGPAIFMGSLIATVTTI